MAVHDQSILVREPVNEVFARWRNLEDFPKFMSHIHEVKNLQGDVYHWKGTVAGIQEEWDAKITTIEPDRLIAWKSVSGFENSGEIRFEPVDNGTKVTVHFEYTPPDGIIGKAAEAVYVGREFDKTLRDDLESFKSRVESEHQRAA